MGVIAVDTWLTFSQPIWLVALLASPLPLLLARFIALVWPPSGKPQQQTLLGLHDQAEEGGHQHKTSNIEQVVRGGTRRTRSGLRDTVPKFCRVIGIYYTLNTQTAVLVI
ncbi:hypothetical protein LCGC14_2218380 [marine sediment metagenome]|uniref:Uncharacterized protein n=1 Tax=marine sediment metagenome TaxID=412755 RepID=A0A0F9DZ89_9ZZZZ